VAPPTKLHLIQQEAPALLGPVREELHQLERRAQGFVDRLHLSAEDEAAVRAAQEALATARTEVERLWRERGGR
jgi:hypothetical protein